jgi:uroporphyrinogen decarboxylase
MTPRERMLKVLHRELPDRVPVVPGFGPWYAARIAGCDMFDIEEGRVHPGKLMAELTRKYDCEMWFWAGYDDEIAELSSNGERTVTTVRQPLDADSYEEVTTIVTPLGTLESSALHSRANPAHARTGVIKDPARDWPIYQAAYGDDWTWGGRTSLTDIPAEDLELGVTSFVHVLPVDFWHGLRHDTAAMVMDLYDGSAAVGAALDWHREYNLLRLAARLRVTPLPDMIHLGGSSSSLSVISPELYRQYNLGFINRVVTLAHSAGVPVMIHHCGRAGKLVEILHEETEVDIVHPLEPPPGGDVDLAEVKRRYGKRLVLFGNLNTFQLMLTGTPAEVKAAARQAIEDAGEGGQFILCTGDQIGRDTTEANVIAMVEAAHEYGQY